MIPGFPRNSWFHWKEEALECGQWGASSVKCYRFMLLLPKFTFYNQTRSGQTFLAAASLRFNSGFNSGREGMTIRFCLLVKSWIKSHNKYKSSVVSDQKLWVGLRRTRRWVGLPPHKTLIGQPTWWEQSFGIFENILEYLETKFLTL